MTRILTTAVVAALLAALAAALVVRSGSGARAQGGRPSLVAQGDFHAVSWGTRGTATIVRDGSGSLTLRFDKKFVTEDAPMLYVYVAGYSHGKRGDWKLAGMLHKAYGSQEFSVPAGVVTGRHAGVMIFCGKCAKIWGEAELAPAPARSA